MKIIRTVTGDIRPEQLGWCQCHEHVFIADGPSKRINEALYMDDYQKSLAEILLYKKAGGCSFVDAQPYGCGRMAQNLVRVSEQTGINIIACTGFHKTEFFENADWLDRQNEDTLSRLYINEVEVGMEQAGTAKAGIIKLAAVKGTYKASAAYAKLFSAAANAAQVTGAPVMVHFDPEADALDLVAYLAERSISPERLIFCHLDRARYDFQYHKELAQAGVYLEYDTIHREKYHSDEHEAMLIEAMVNEGYASKLLLGLDTTNQRLKNYGAPFGLDDILTRFSAMLAERIGQQAVELMMISNPASALLYR